MSAHLETYLCGVHLTAYFSLKPLSSWLLGFFVSWALGLLVLGSSVHRFLGYPFSRPLVPPFLGLSNFWFTSYRFLSTVPHLFICSSSNLSSVHLLISLYSPVPSPHKKPSRITNKETRHIWRVSLFVYSKTLLFVPISFNAFFHPHQSFKVIIIAPDHVIIWRPISSDMVGTMLQQAFCLWEVSGRVIFH